MKGTVHYEVKDGVAILTVDNPPVNPLSDGVRAGFVNNIDKAENDPDVLGVVLTGAGRSFIAGADIKEFASFSIEEGKQLSAKGHQLLFDLSNQFSPYEILQLVQEQHPQTPYEY